MNRIFILLLNVSSVFSMEGEQNIALHQNTTLHQSTRTFEDFKALLNSLFIGFYGENFQNWAVQTQKNIIEDYNHEYWIDSVISFWNKGSAIKDTYYKKQKEKIVKCFVAFDSYQEDELGFLLSFLSADQLDHINELSDYINII